MSVDGAWYNELGSKMTIDVDDESLTGEYDTAVGQAGGLYDLVGSLDVDGDPRVEGQAIGWVVVWNNDAHGNSHSITAWSGQYQIIDDEETIVALWLLTGETPAKADWSATRINQDLFTRNPPDEERIRRALKRNQIPHPLSLMGAAKK